MGDRAAINCQDRTLHDVSVKQQPWFASRPKKQERSCVKWKFMKLCDAKLPFDFPLKSSVKSTMCVVCFCVFCFVVLSDVCEEGQSPMRWGA